MSKKITIVALVALMLLLVSLPANAAVNESSVEIRGSVVNATALKASGGNASWDYANFAGFWYDLKDNKQTESMTITKFDGERNIAKADLVYTTKAEPIMFKVSKEKNRTVEYGLESTGKNYVSTGGKYYDVVGWIADKYIAVNAKPNKLAKLVYEQDAADKMTLTVGQTWEIGGGYTLTAQSIDARSNPRLAWFVLSKDGAKLDDKVIEAAASDGTGTQGVYTYYANVGGESNVPIFVTYIDSVFSGATSDMVQLKYTWLIDTNIMEIKSADTYGLLQVVSTSSDEVKLENNYSINLASNSTINLAGNIKFNVIDNATQLTFFPTVGPRLNITASSESIPVGIATNVIFTVTSKGSPITGATISLRGAGVGNGVTQTNGQASMSINAAYNGTI
ncbi:MAG: hypothetical protein MUO43_10560, partial [Desulfobacterales bacterium]|nr:hypothetical protein [Desulfobacterales bacterium]